MDQDGLPMNDEEKQQWLSIAARLAATGGLIGIVGASLIYALVQVLG